MNDFVIGPLTQGQNNLLQTKYVRRCQTSENPALDPIPPASQVKQRLWGLSCPPSHVPTLTTPLMEL